MWRNEKKGNVIKLQKDGRGNKVANSHYQRKHTLRAPSKKRASTFRHKYKILDALKLTWQIGIPAQGGTVKRSHKLLLTSPSSKDFSGLKRRSTQEINSSAALHSTHTETDRQGRSKITASLSQDVGYHYLMKSAPQKWGMPTQHPSPCSLYLLTSGNNIKYCVLLVASSEPQILLHTSKF